MDGAAVVFRGTERFQLVRLIGRGGMGVVYEAFDTVNLNQVAMKLLPLFSPELLLRFKREFRIVANVRHRNLVRLGELVAHETQWFFTMELVDGIDLVSYVRGQEARGPSSLPQPQARRAAAKDTLLAPVTTPPPPSPARGIRDERLRPTLAQLAEALIALHAAGCVHRDVKPSNVLVTKDGRAVVLDFGLASTSTVETTLLGAGTPAYMAPEQAAQQPVTPAADWYAFGVILFELLVGRLPLEGLPHEILYRKQHEPPPAARLAAPTAPADLAALCDRLLATDPAARPAGSEVLALLSAPGPVSLSSRDAARDSRPQLMGRERELASLTAALDTVRTGAGPAAVIVRGESGVGKSALVESFVATATRDDCIILTSRCHERELVPFKAIDGLVDALTRVLRRLDPEAMQRVLPARAETLLQAFPVLGRVDAFAQLRREGFNRDPGEVRTAMFGAFRELLAGLGREAPILAVIDDLQWADGDSLALLTDALAGPVGPRLLLLGTLRPATGTTSERLFPPKVNEQALPLDNLSQTVACALARVLLTAAGARDVDSYAPLVARESSGHPLFLLELTRTAHVRADDGRPLTLDGVLRSQIDVLSPHAVRLLRALAIAGAPLKLAVARKAAGLDGAAMVESLDDLRSARLVHSASERGDDVVDIAHDRIRQLLRASTSPAEAAGLHESLARAFDDGGDPLRAGEHWRDAGRLDRAAVHFAAAGRRAAELLAFDRAASAFQMALAFDGWSLEEQRGLTIGLADAMSNAGRGAAAAPHYLAAADTAGTARGLELRRRATEELLRTGHIDEGRAVAARALADAGLEFPRSPIRALLWLRTVLRLRGLRFRPRALEEVAPRELARIDLCWSLSSGLALTEPVRGAHFQVRSLLLALRAGDTSRVARGIAGEAAYAAALGDHGGAARHLRKAIALAEKVADPHLSGIVSLMRGLSEHLRGQFSTALENLDAAEQTFRARCVGTAWELNAARQFSLECLYYLGELSRFATSAADGIKEAEDRGSVYASTTLRSGLCNAVWLIRDDPARARAEVDEAMQRWTFQGYHVQHWYELIARTQIDLYAGDGEAAWARVEDQWPSLERSNLLRLQHTRIVALHLRARAALAAAMDQSGAVRDQRLRVASACARRLLRQGDGWNRGLASMVQAGVAAVAGQREQAAASLVLATQLADRYGLRLHRAAADIIADQHAPDASPGAPAGSWMTRAGVAAPARLAHMLMPGWRDDARR